METTHTHGTNSYLTTKRASISQLRRTCLVPAMRLLNSELRLFLLKAVRCMSVTRIMLDLFQAKYTELRIRSVYHRRMISIMGAQYCSTIDLASRSPESSETSFLNAAKERRNLKVYIATRAIKIRFDARLQATGVAVVGSTVITTFRRTGRSLSAPGCFSRPKFQWYRVVVRKRYLINSILKE